MVQAIRVEMKPELIPLAEDKANFGKLVKKAIRYTNPAWIIGSLV
jgi:hypothetical protein